MTSTRFPHLPGILSTADLARTADSIEQLQLDNGMIMWYPNGHCDPWNHVETAMALDVMGRHDAAMRAYHWLADIQREDGSWHNYYLPDGSVEESKLDTNVCAYIATGMWHHWLSTNNLDDVAEMWLTVKRALSWVLSCGQKKSTIPRGTMRYSLDAPLFDMHLTVVHYLAICLVIRSHIGAMRRHFLTASFAPNQMHSNQNTAGQWTGITRFSLVH
jgi:hypothetical protein